MGLTVSLRKRGNKLHGCFVIEFQSIHAICDLLIDGIIPDEILLLFVGVSSTNSISGFGGQHISLLSLQRKDLPVEHEFVGPLSDNELFGTLNQMLLRSAVS